MSHKDKDIIDSLIAVEDVGHFNASMISQLPGILQVVEKYANAWASTTPQNKTPDWSITSNDNYSAKNLLLSKKNDQNKELKAWGLSQKIARKYAERGITEMFEWQVSCLQNPKVLLKCSNLVYSAPTSAGKTLVAEILTIKTILERRKKVIIILPFVSIVREKMFYLQDILSSSGIRVEGFMGSQSPPGGLHSVDVAVCTIEKANSLVNRLLDEGTIPDLGAVVVDELHLLGDPHRGYILELLLTKVKYVSETREDVKVQIIAMSATLSNLDVLARWLDAELYITLFRPIPLNEYCLAGKKLFNKDGILVRTMEDAASELWANDNVLKICFDTIKDGCSVLIFCMTKSRCESLAQNIASSFLKLVCSDNEIAHTLREQLKTETIFEVLEQLKNCPVGLDSGLKKVISFGVAYHHAGLTLDERDIIEEAFKSGAIRVLVATSTLSASVNLQASVVIIKEAILNNKPMNILTYKQMIGKAGRMGKDKKGESIIICTSAAEKACLNLMMGTVAVSSSIDNDDKFLRAVLEIIASEVACTQNNLIMFAKCTLLIYQPKILAGDVVNALNLITKTLVDLQNFRLIKSQYVNRDVVFVPTSLGKACLVSSLAPHDGLIIFCEIQKAKLWSVLKTELLLIYLVTPFSVSNQWVDIDWQHMLKISSSLTKCIKKLGLLLGIHEGHVMRFTKMPSVVDNLENPINIHKRFYLALALQELVNEVPLNKVATKFRCSRGFLQSLQQSAATFAGMVAAFCQQLQYKNIEMLISQFQERLKFGIHSELLELMKLPSINGLTARSLYNAGFETVANVASADVNQLEDALVKAVDNNVSNVFNSKGNKECENKGTKMEFSIEIGSIKNKTEVKEIETESVNFYEGKIEVEEHDVTTNINENLLGNNAVPAQVTNQTHQTFNVESLRDLVINKELEKKYSTMPKEDYVWDSIYVTHTNTSNINRNDNFLPQIETNIEHTMENSLLPDYFGIFDDNLPVELKVVLLSNIEDDEQTPDADENDFILDQSDDLNNDIILSNMNEDDQAPDSDDFEDIELIRRESPQPTESNAIIAPTLSDSNDKLKLRKRSLNDKQKRKPKRCNKRPRLNIASKNYTKINKIIDNRPVNNVDDEQTPDADENDFSLVHNDDHNNDNILSNMKKDGQAPDSDDIEDFELIRRKTPQPTESNAVIALTLSNSNDKKPKLRRQYLKNKQKGKPKRCNNRPRLNRASNNNTQINKINDNRPVNNVDDEQTPDADKNDFSLVHNDDHNNDNILSNMEEDGEAPDSDDIEDFELIRRKSPQPTESNAVIALTSSNSNDKKPKSRRRSLKNKQKGKPKRCNNRPRLNRASNNNTQINKINDNRPTNDKNLFLNNFMRFMHGSGEDSESLKKQNDNNVASGSPVTRKIENTDITFCVFERDTVLPKLDDLFEIDCAAIYFDIKQPEEVEQKVIVDQNNVNNTADMASPSDIGEINYLAICCSKEIVYAFDLSPFAKTSPVYSKFEEWFRRRTLHLVVLSSNKTTTMIRKHFGVEMLASCYDVCLCEWLMTKNIFLNLGPAKSKTDDLETTCFKAMTIWLTAKKQQKNLQGYQLMQRSLADDNQVSLILTRSEWYGLTVDLKHASDLLIAVKSLLEDTKNTAYRIAKHQFDLHSPQEVTKVLQVGRRRARRCSNHTNAKNSYSKLHCSSLPNAIMIWRQLKAIWDILCPLTENINFKEDNKIHPSYFMLTNTGRMIMNRLNLQSLPRAFSIPRSYLHQYKSEDLVELNCRDIIKASPGYVLVTADYCQLELRILTFLSKDPNLTEIMKSDVDVFTMIAARWSDIKSDDVDDNLRQRAKQMFYGTLYYGQKTSEMLELTLAEATGFAEYFYNTFPDIKSFAKTVFEEWVRTGHVETLLQRWRFLPEVKDLDTNLIRQTLGQAIMIKVQGSASDIVKAAMCEVDNRTRDLDDFCKPRLVLQMHDELVYEVPEAYKNNFITTLKYAMEINTLQCVKSKIYLPIKLTTGLTYGSLTEL